jgi:formate dehydrogenase iron-sulfur subunit
LVEVEQGGVRHGYGPFAPTDVPRRIFDGTLEGLGPVEEIPFFARQHRLTFARVGRIDPLSL